MNTRILRLILGTIIALASGFVLLLRALPVQAGGSVTNCANDSELTQRLGGGGLVTFNCNGTNAPASIVLSALKTITQNTTINGGNVIALSGGRATQLFMVNASAALTLTNITIRDGYSSGNDGGAVFVKSGGALTAISSKFYSNTTTSNWSGGAIIAYGRLKISNSEFAYNAGGNGGALYPRWAAVVSISNSSFHHNQAINTSFGSGGAMMLWDGPQVTVDSGTTFFSNTAYAGGAIFVMANSALTLTNTSIGYNRALTATGGGLEVDGRAFISNTQIYTNQAFAAGGGINSAAGAQLSIMNSRVEYNRALYTSGKTLGGGIRSAGNLAITGTFITGNRAGVGQSGSAGGGIYHEIGNLTLSGAAVEGNHAIHGAGIYVNSGVSQLSGLSVSGNFAESGDGGGLYVGSGSTLVRGANFSGNYAVYDGGAISNRGTLTVTQSTLNGNGAYIGGGALENYGTATLLSSTLANNHAIGGGVGYGGGIRNSNGSMALINTIVSANTANYDGGGIYNQATLTLDNSTVRDNIDNGGDGVENTVHGGGGIFNSGNVTLRNSTVSGNTAQKRDGGGVYNYRGLFWAFNSTFSGNTADGWGGGVISDHGYTSLVHVTLSGNAAAAGGGIYNLTIFLTRTVLLQNTLIANSPRGYNCAQFAGSQDVQSYGYNLSDDNAFNSFCLGSFQALDLSNANAHLGLLANHGGATLTHLPLPGSAAIDAIPIGTNGCGTMYSSDQRGAIRPVNGDGDPAVKCDIGAVEYRPGDTSPWVWLPFALR